MRRLVWFVFCLLACGSLPAHAESDAPWRLQEALSFPEALQLSVEQRFRIESLDDQFRIRRHGHDRAWASRTLAHARIHLADVGGLGDFTFGAELIDSRIWAADRSVTRDTTLVNTAELLQGYAQFATDIPEVGKLRVRGGRMTMNLGSRRLVARNRFRNTINAFTGVEAEWTSDSGQTLRGFYTLPVQRQPTELDKLRDNDIEFDEESFDLQLYGAFFSTPLVGLDAAEFYFYGLKERDRERRPSRNRELYTPGFRLLRKPQAGAFDFNVEAALQFGETRASSSARNDLEHFAQFYHGEIGYLFDCAFSPRISAQYDWATGDNSPGDGRNERFDTLFGARAFDFGPTSLFGAFARSNINTPGAKFEVVPWKNVSAFVAYRAYWLASERDTWTTSGVRDPSGQTRRFVGHQVWARVRWDVLPRNLRLEAGIAHLFRGEFLRGAPNANGQGAPTYVYGQTTISF
ncbi:MAG: alginate export family protein [Myxococcota bacterium]